MSDNLSNREDSNSIGFDLISILFTLLRSWRTILAFSILGFFLAYYSYISSDRVFKISSLIKVSESGMPLTDITNPMSSDQMSLEDLTYIYKARANIAEIIEKLHLNVVQEDGIYENKVFFKKFTINNFEKDEVYKTFFIKTFEKNFELFDENEDLISRISFGELYNENNLSIEISSSSYEKGELKQLIVYDPKFLIRSVTDKINLDIKKNSSAFFITNSGLIQISYTDSNINRAKSIVDLANEIFIKKNIDSASQKARSAVSFLENQTEVLRDQLNLNQAQLNNFQKTNQTLNIDLETASIINQLSSLESKIREIDLEISKLSDTYTFNNPLYKELINQKEELINQKDELNSQIVELPLSQQEYIDLYKNVEISQNSLVNLINLKLEYSILEASTIGNIEIVDYAYNQGQISPTLSFPFVIVFLFIVTGILFALIRKTFFSKIENPAELQDRFDKKVIGVIPFLTDDFNIEEIPDNLSQSISALMYSITNNEKFVKDTNKKKVILITSALKEAGKSTISQIISNKLASLGHKTLLIDLDFKKGSQHKYFGTEKILANDFLELDKANLKKYQIKENLTLIPKIKKVGDSFHFVSSDIFADRFESLIGEFDFVVIDTAPILSIVDTNVLFKFADFKIQVVRHQNSKMSTVDQALFLIEQSGEEIDGFVYNAYKESGSYRYYGYTNYGYKYQYYASKYLYNDYDYDENK